jgi:hypothetical protein
MDTTYEHDVSLSIDMDDLGVRPLDWLDFNKNLDSIDDLFGKEKTINCTVYTVVSGNKLTTDEDEMSMSDDDGSNDYDIDPETGMFQISFSYLVTYLSIQIE